MATQGDWILAEQLNTRIGAGAIREGAFCLSDKEMADAISQHMAPERSAAKAMRDWMERRTKACESGTIPCWCGELDKLVAAYDAAVEER